jgi:uncharacterized protein YqeY
MIQERIKKDLKESMISKQILKKDLLRTVIGEFNRIGKDITDDKCISIIKKMKENAKELNNQEEIEILSVYLPEILNEEQIKDSVNSIMEGKNYTNKDIGLIMKTLKENHGQKIDMKIASKFVKQNIN